MRRNLDYEQTFLKAVFDEAQRRAGVDVGAFVSTVQARLDQGSERYGDRHLQDRGFDMLAEACEEGPDIAAYGLLELHRRNHAGLDGGVHHAVFEAAVHAALADAWVRYARACARGTS